LLVVSLVAGSIVGVRARVNQWLSPGPKTVAKYWRDAGLPLEEASIIQRIFDREFAMTRGDHVATANEPVLFAADAALCDTLRRYANAQPIDAERLRLEMQHSGNSALAEFANEVSDPQSLKAAFEVFVSCPKSAAR
jgi:hypothetical protein